MKILIGLVRTGAFAAVAIVGGGLAANAAPCATTTLDTYVATGFTCTIGDKTFSDFTYGTTVSGTGVASPATSVGVTPLLSGNNYGFMFTGVWNSGSGPGVGDAALGYIASVTSGAALIDSASLSLTGALTGTGATGTVGESICAGGVLPSCTGGALDLLSVSAAGPLSDSVTFAAPVSTVDVLKDIDSATSSTSGTASISIVDNTVDQVQVPEPASLALLGSALIGFGAVRRRRKAS